MDILAGREASPKFRSVLFRRKLERVNPYWVYEFGVLCQTPGFRPADLMILMPGLHHTQIARGVNEVQVSERDVQANVMSIGEDDAVMFMKLGALPSYSVSLVWDRMRSGRMKAGDLAAVLGVDVGMIRKARGSERLLFVDKR